LIQDAEKMNEKEKRISRRKFLLGSGEAAAGIFTMGALTSCTCPQSWGQGKGASKMRFGLVTYQWARDWDLSTLISNCQKAEVFGVELRTTHKHGVEPSLTVAQRRDVKKRFADSGVTLVCVGSDERFDNPDPDVLAGAIETTKKFIKLSYDVGSSGVKVKPDRFHEDVPHQKTIEQIGNSLNIVGNFATDYGQQVRLEVHNQCADLTIIKSIMDIADHPNVAICWNCNQEDLQGKGLEYNFNLVKNRLGHTVHTHSLKSTPYPYQQLIGLLAKINYTGWLELEEGRYIPPDPVEALVQERIMFEQMIAEA
jgi:sugar phosphate isomerase/epimerase